MADCRCARCGLTQPVPEPLGYGLRAVAVCPNCKCLIVTEQGEMGSPEDHAEPDEWGGIGWI